MELREVTFLNELYFNGLKDSPFFSQEPLLDEEFLKEDRWGFGYFWREIVRKFSTVDQLYNAIQDLHDQIRDLKEKYRPFCTSFPDGELKPNLDRGVSGSYIFMDEAGNPLYVVKPLDEDAGCIHSDGFATPFSMSPLRANMPLYLSAMREVLAYQIAQLIQVGDVVPQTSLGILTSDTFHDFSEQVNLDELKRYLDTVGFADKEKLCSVQEYIPNSKNLFEVLHELQQAGLSDEEIGARFDQENFENANLLLWTTYDTDGHQGNFLVYSKGTDAVGNEILGLKKIDNGLAFPDKNQQMRNNLSYMPNASRLLSEGAKEKIAAIDVDLLAHQFEQMGLESAIPALRERVAAMKEAAQRPEITIKEMNQVISNIGKKV